jgi:light-regulated signal transduction histidine kinase (bacteriophytochrome)
MCSMRRADLDRPLVNVSVMRRSDEWVFSVRDNGVGIQASARERVFRLFEKLTIPTDQRGASN